MQAKGVEEHVSKAVVDECAIVVEHHLPQQEDIDGIRSDIKDVDSGFKAEIQDVNSKLERLEQARKADNDKLLLEIQVSHERLIAEIEKSRTEMENQGGIRYNGQLAQSLQWVLLSLQP